MGTKTSQWVFKSLDPIFPFCVVPSLLRCLIRVNMMGKLQTGGGFFCCQHQRHASSTSLRRSRGNTEQHLLLQCPPIPPSCLPVSCLPSCLPSPPTPKKTLKFWFGGWDGVGAPQSPPLASPVHHHQKNTWHFVFFCGGDGVGAPGWAVGVTVIRFQYKTV